MHKRLATLNEVGLNTSKDISAAPISGVTIGVHSKAPAHGEWLLQGMSGKAKSEEEIMAIQSSLRSLYTGAIEDEGLLSTVNAQLSSISDRQALELLFDRVRAVVKPKEASRKECDDPEERKTKELLDLLPLIAGALLLPHNLLILLPISAKCRDTSVPVAMVSAAIALQRGTNGRFVHHLYCMWAYIRMPYLSLWFLCDNTECNHYRVCCMVTSRTVGC
jgi:hypothetical protein